MTDAPTDEIIIERQGPLGLVLLNRPKALNALSLGMVRTLDKALVDWAGDDAVKAVVVRSLSDKAFCAGGDVRAVATDAMKLKSGESAGELVRHFFYDEYRLNRRIHHYKKPYVALIDGITMGGGVGISAHGSHAVATERTVVAMPETAIGFFPDVGGTWLLSRCPGALGQWFGLTGGRMNAGDALACGFAKAVIASTALDDVTAALAVADWSSDAGQAVDRVLGDFAIAPPAGHVQSHRALIDRCCSAPTVAAMFDRLAAETDPFAAETLATLALMAPLSLAVTQAAITRAATLDFDAVMQMEYRLNHAFMARPDFVEGIRARLIDKDHAPRWTPATLAEIEPALIESFFSASVERPLTFP